MIAGQVGPGPWYQRWQARHEVFWAEQDVGGAIAEGMLELVASFPIDSGREPLEADGRPGFFSVKVLRPASGPMVTR